MGTPTGNVVSSEIQNFAGLSGPYRRVPKIFSLPYYPEMVEEVQSIIEKEKLRENKVVNPAGKLLRTLLKVEKENRVSVADLHDIVVCLVTAKYASACEPYTEEEKLQEVRDTVCRELELTVTGYGVMAREYAKNGYGAYSRKRLVELIRSQKAVLGNETEEEVVLIPNLAEEMFNRILILVHIDALRDPSNENEKALSEITAG